MTALEDKKSDRFFPLNQSLTVYYYVWSVIFPSLSGSNASLFTMHNRRKSWAQMKKNNLQYEPNCLVLSCNSEDFDSTIGSIIIS